MGKYKKPSIWAKAGKRVAQFLQIPLKLKDIITDPIYTATGFLVDKLAEKDITRKNIGMQRHRVQTFDNEKGWFVVINPETDEVIREGNRQPYKGVRIKKQKTINADKPITKIRQEKARQARQRTHEERENKRNERKQEKHRQARQRTCEERENKRNERKQEKHRPARQRTRDERVKNGDKPSQSRGEKLRSKESRDR